MKKRLVSTIAVISVAALTLAGCGSTSSEVQSAASENKEAQSENTAVSSAEEAKEPASGDDFTFKVAFENTMDEPVGQGLQKWQSLLQEENAGVQIELYPDSQLGAKSALMDSMLMGDNVITLTDGSFYAEYGVRDFSVFYAPFLFDDWDQVWKLIDSDWYDSLCEQLDEKGLHIIASNWIYGARQLMTDKQVTTPADLKGLKIRVPDNLIQTESFNVMGGTSVALALGDVYQGLTAGTVDGVENPLATLYGRSFQEVCDYLLLTNHVMNSTTWVCSSDLWNSLTPEQQEALTKTCEEAGKYNNEVYEKEDANYLQKMKDAGVTVTELTEEQRQEWKDAAAPIWDEAEKFSWSDGLKETVEGIIKE